MAERFADLESALQALGTRIAVPPAPSITPAVVSRLETERLRRRRPPFPGLALWSRRRALMVAAFAVLAVLALAAAARFTIGAVQIRIQPTPSATSGTPPSFDLSVLGPARSPSDAAASLPFRTALPAGPRPDAAYIVEGPTGQRSVAFAWLPSTTYPRIEGTPWGLIVLEIPGDDELVLKTLNAFQDMVTTVVQGRPAAWIPAPHELELRTRVGSQTFSVGGNVLIWERSGVTYRVETALGSDAAAALAASIGG
ncbi:MAG: hypothetical protein ABI879_01900 [Actinomycetota bacterium]